MKRVRFDDRRVVMAAVFVVLAVWSSLSYLVIRVDADILAEAIQVQRWIADPFVVLSYPGQLYGGVLEYPIIAFAESLLPGQIYAFTALRILYLPIVGVLTVYATSLLFPNWRLSILIPAAFVGPAVLHSMMAIKDLYPFSWMLGMIGVAITYSRWRSGARSWWLLLGGAFLGLAIYQHPTTSLLVVPLGVAGLVRWRPRGLQLWTWVAGGVLGLAPLVLARFGQGNVYVAYTPGRDGNPNVAGAFGLDGAAWSIAIVPNGWGVQYSDLNAWALPTWLQLIVNVGIFAFIGYCVVVTLLGVVSRQLARNPSDARVMAAMWTAAAVVVVAIVIVVPPVFFYGSALAVSVWITITAGVNALWGRPGLTLAIAVMVIAGVTSVGSVLAWNPALPGAIGFKKKQADQIAEVAKRIQEADIDIVFGDYWETLPIAYASVGGLSAVTLPVSRFPFTGVGDDTIVVAVPTGYTALPPGLERWTNAEAAVGFVDANCTRLSIDVVVDPFPIRTYECPVSALR